jgi:large subunit ribosomal protein L23
MTKSVSSAPMSIVDQINSFVFTSKSVQNVEEGKYVFDVAENLSKPILKKLFEDIYGVQIASLNTYRLPPKKRRFGQFQGRVQKFKRVIVTLKDKEQVILS